MGLKTFVQEKILLPRKWKHYRQNRQKLGFIGLDKAKKIGIITDFRETSLVRIVSEFHKKIKKADVSISLVALVQDQRNNFNQFEYERQFPGSLVYLVASDELNRWEQPQSKLIEPFLEQEYDIIFFLDRTYSFTLYNIILSTKSKMVAGRISEDREIVDFGIELDQSAPLESLTENLYKYLTSIGKNETSAHTEEQDFKLF